MKYLMKRKSPVSTKPHSDPMLRHCMYLYMQAQRRRIGALWPGHREIDPDDDLPPPPSPSPLSNASSSSPQKPNGSASSLCSDMARVRAHLSRCANDEDAPVVVYVSKMVAVRNAELVDMLASSSPSSPALPLDGESFVGFARVFSGVLKPNARLHVLGPKYHPQRRRSAAHAKALTPDADPENPDETAEKPRLGLYMMMGTSLHPVPHMPAGNLVAILGLEGHVLKCATLADTLACPALTPMTLQVRGPLGKDLKPRLISV
jgi:translation elongation factor EF-G